MFQTIFWLCFLSARKACDAWRLNFHCSHVCHPSDGNSSSGERKNCGAWWKCYIKSDVRPKQLQKKLHWNFYSIHISFFIDAIEIFFVYITRKFPNFKDESATACCKLSQECKFGILTSASACAPKITSENYRKQKQSKASRALETETTHRDATVVAYFTL